MASSCLGLNELTGSRPTNDISKLDQILEGYGLKCTLPIASKFCTCHNNVAVVTCAKFHCDRLSVFQTRALQILIEFNQNIVSGTGTWWHALSSHGSYENLCMKFNDFSMTFPWPFQVVTAGFIIENSNKMHPGLTSFSGAMCYTLVLLWPLYE